MTLVLWAARRLAFALGAFLLVAAPPLPPNIVADSTNAYARLGHAWMSVDTNLRGPSHLSAWAIDDYLARTTPLPALGHAFKSAEAKYDVNALYLLAHAMHETAFGTSYIGRRFHNLFGWHAADRDPTGLAMRFRTYAASVDYVAGQVSDQFLSPTGEFFGGAPTLRGMRHYASDPLWGPLIARIANGIVLSTLGRRGVVFDQPVVDDASTGQATRVTVTTTAGQLPDGLHAAYRFVPVAIVEAGALEGPVPAADPAFQLADGVSRSDRLDVAIDAPKRAGRYRLELQVRDSDGTPLTELDVPQIPDTAVRVYGSDAVAYHLEQDPDGLTVTVTNEGRRAIPPTSTLADSSQGPPMSPIPTMLTAWLIANDGSPELLAKVILDTGLEPAGTWTARLPLPDPATLPAVLVVRLEVGDEPGRLGGSPPGVFALVAAPQPGPSTAPAADPSPDPSLSPAPDAVAQPDAVPATLGIVALTPVDAATRMLLNPGWRPTASGAGTPSVAGSKGSPTTAAKTLIARLAFQAIVNPSEAGSARVRITNTGTAAFLAGGLGSTTGAELIITSVPAWGPASEPIGMTIPLPIDLSPGASLEIGIHLPPSTVGQSTYLVAARAVPAGGGTPVASTVFWLRSAPADPMIRSMPVPPA